MGKQGPCCHCGVPSTPVWRNGPPNKPILCNACGSRWRTKGSLTNYTPLHARGEPDMFLNNKASRIKIVSGRDKELKLLKRKQIYENGVIRNFASDYSDGFLKATDDDTSNRSSSGSVVSNSHSFAIDAERTNPAKKRASVPHPKSSSIASLTKDLCTILQQQQSSGFYKPGEDDLLFENGESIFSAETGHGSYLIRDNSSITRDEDSETSSFSVDNKLYITGEACSYSKSQAVNTSDVRIGGVSTNLGIIQQENTERKNKLSEVSECYGSHSFPLTEIIDQKEVLISNHENFPRYLTNGDDLTEPNGHESLSCSTEIVTSLSSFNEGMFNASPPDEVKSDEYKKLKRIVFKRYNMAKV